MLDVDFPILATLISLVSTSTSWVGEWVIVSNKQSFELALELEQLALALALALELEHRAELEL